MREHTPGPWKVRVRKVGGEVVDCFVAAPDVLGYSHDAEILGDDEYRDGIERKLADARLIAAAPDLLAALKQVIGWIETSAEGEEATKIAYAAIAKATGESHD